ncbi:ERF family protein (plasmid) [Fructilactobacillus ixorae]|uniref:ERF family protein n=1 Tax=Fructilactobacillus ixorae TaxID=1750535 RepID=A0ABY5C828_9LACO|nr:ERF family protein [Fructilactobacillus ixorae]USS93973.1 ERF family protein [Fructilactobacillus ixorae]
MTDTKVSTIQNKLIQFNKIYKQPTKNAVNPFTKSKYADLNEIIESLKVPLDSVGLFYRQVPVTEYDENGHLMVGIQTIIFDGEDSEDMGVFKLPPKSTNPQDVGSLLTYLRRYTLSAIFGIAADADDDGNLASGRNQQSNGNQRQRQQQRRRPAQNSQSNANKQDNPNAPATDVMKNAIKKVIAEYAKLTNTEESTMLDMLLTTNSVNPQKMTIAQARLIYSQAETYLKKEKKRLKDSETQDNPFDGKENAVD